MIITEKLDRNDEETLAQLRKWGLDEKLVLQLFEPAELPDITLLIADGTILNQVEYGSAGPFLILFHALTESGALFKVLHKQRVLDNPGYVLVPQAAILSVYVRPAGFDEEDAAEECPHDC